PPQAPDCVNQPEPANQECGFRETEVICGDITHNMEVAPKFHFDGLHGGHKTGIFGRDESQFGKKQRAGVQIVASEGAGESFALRAPRALEQFSAYFVRGPAPVLGAVRQAEMGGYGLKPLASRPAHRGRVRVHALSPAIFPNTRIRKHGKTRRLLPERLKPLEKRLVAWPR